MSNSDREVLNLIKLFYRKRLISNDDLERLNIDEAVQKNIRKVGRQKSRKIWLCKNWDKIVMAMIGIFAVIIGISQCSTNRQVAEMQKKQDLEPKLSFSFNPEDADPEYVILNIPNRVPFFVDFEKQKYGKRKCKFIIANGPEKGASNILLKINVSEEPDIPFQISAVAIRDPSTKEWLDNTLWEAKPPSNLKEYKKVTIKIDWMNPEDKLEIYCLFVYLLPKPQNKDKAENAMTIKLRSMDQKFTKSIIQKFPLLY